MNISYDDKYAICNGTYYNKDSSDEIILLLESIRGSQTRCRFHWGNTKTGQDWGEIHDVSGRIGRSTGIKPIPLLIYNSRCHGGGALFSNCIVKITATQGGKVLYQHPKYHL